MVIEKHSMASPCDASTFSIRFHLKLEDHKITENLSVISPASDGSTFKMRISLKQDDHLILENPFLTSPVSEEYLLNIRLHHRPAD